MLFATACSDVSSQPVNESSSPDIVVDIKQICSLIPENYIYFAPRQAHWDEACDAAITDARALTGTKGTLAIMERLIDDLYDPHISLNKGNQNSPRLVPSGADLWFELRGGDYAVAAIRPQSGAAATDITIGDILVSFNGNTPGELAASRIHNGKRNIPEARQNWAVNAAIAGRRSEDRELVLKRSGTVKSYALGNPVPPTPPEPLTYSRPAPDIGYIRFHNSLGDNDAVAAFHQALKTLRDTNGLILDLRDTPGGGGTSVAEPIMGRFIDKTQPYQRIVPRDKPAWNRKVSRQRPWQYDKPLIVLVGRWTGSMGEGMAIGFDAMGRAEVMGDHMAGLAGGVEGFKLPETGVSIRFPTYDLHHLDGTPRHQWRPETVTTADNGNHTDMLISKAVTRLQRR